jgi:hypothetical protein
MACALVLSISDMSELVETVLGAIYVVQQAADYVRETPLPILVKLTWD